LGLEEERGILDRICSSLTEKEFSKMREDGIIPSKILLLADIDPETEMLVSRKWGDPLVRLDILFSYENLLKLKKEFKVVVDGAAEWDDMIALFDEYRPSSVQWSEGLYERILLLVKRFGFDYIKEDLDMYDFWMGVCKEHNVIREETGIVDEYYPNDIMEVESSIEEVICSEEVVVEIVADVEGGCGDDLMSQIRNKISKFDIEEIF